jgi:predicted nucleotide-binding protein with TIR-like domain/PilZ domain-containing protein
MALEARQNPRVFVGSSNEGKTLAENLQLELGEGVDATLWSQGVFGLSKGILEELVRAPQSYDFAVLVLTSDDLSYKRGVESNAPRDNVIFELGLFMGALGRERTFVVCARDEPLELPSDLAGILVATYHSREDGNLQAALGPACTQIKKEIRRIMGMPRAASATPARKPQRRKKVARRRRRRSLGTAQAARPLNELRIVDISETGALLETDGEIPVGHLLSLNLTLENGNTAQVTARVVRVQYPEWGKVGGVGVTFTEFDGRSEEIIKEYTAAQPDGSDRYDPPSDGSPDGLD